MSNNLYALSAPDNEPILNYAPGSVERTLLEAELRRQSDAVLDIPLIIAGEEVRTGNTAQVTMPHQRKHVLATYHKAGEKEIRLAIQAAASGQGKRQNHE